MKLNAAILAGNKERVTTVLQRAPSISTLLNKRDSKQNTALHLAAQTGHTDIVHTLVHHKADIEALDKNLATPLYWAARNGHDKVAKCLIDHKANINIATTKGITPLHKAAQYGHRFITSILIDHKANMAAVTQKGHTPLHLAASFHQPLTLSALINQPHFDQAMWLSRDKAGYNALHYALGDPVIVNTLLTHAHCPLAMGLVIDKQGDNILHLAVKKQAAQTVFILLQHPTLAILLNGQQNKKGRTPFDQALISKNSIDLLSSFNQCIHMLTKGKRTEPHILQKAFNLSRRYGWAYLLFAHIDKIKDKDLWQMLILQAMAYRQSTTLKRVADMIRINQPLYRIIKEELLDVTLETNSDWLLAKTLQFPTRFFVQTNQLDWLKHRLEQACQKRFSSLRRWLTQIDPGHLSWRHTLPKSPWHHHTLLRPFNTHAENTFWETTLAQFLSMRALSQLQLTARYYHHRFHPKGKIEHIVALCTPKPIEKDPQAITKTGKLTATNPSGGCKQAASDEKGSHLFSQ